MPPSESDRAALSGAQSREERERLAFEKASRKETRSWKDRQAERELGLWIQANRDPATRKPPWDELPSHLADYMTSVVRGPDRSHVLHRRRKQAKGFRRREPNQAVYVMGLVRRGEIPERPLSPKSPDEMRAIVAAEAKRMGREVKRFHDRQGMGTLDAPVPVEAAVSQEKHWRQNVYNTAIWLEGEETERALALALAADIEKELYEFQTTEVIEFRALHLIRYVRYARAWEFMVHHERSRKEYAGLVH